MAEGRKIHCVCGKYLGEIRDATLRTGLVYLCRECNADRRRETRIDEMMGGLFGSKKKK